MPDLPEPLKGDIEEWVAEIAWDFCSRLENGEKVELAEYLAREPMSKDPRAAEEFKLVVNMHLLLRFVEPKPEA